MNFSLPSIGLNLSVNISCALIPIDVLMVLLQLARREELNTSSKNLPPFPLSDDK